MKETKVRQGARLSVSTRPECLETMLSYAAKLSEGFPEVRVDFYEVGSKVYFGEMTFTTSGNILWNYTPKVIQEWGEELVLPDKLKSKWKDTYKI